jgi:hypothetical protein
MHENRRGGAGVDTQYFDLIKFWMQLIKQLSHDYLIFIGFFVRGGMEFEW